MIDGVVGPHTSEWTSSRGFKDIRVDKEKESWCDFSCWQASRTEILELFGEETTNLFVWRMFWTTEEDGCPNLLRQSSSNDLTEIKA